MNLHATDAELDPEPRLIPFHSPWRRLAPPQFAGERIAGAARPDNSAVSGERPPRVSPHGDSGEVFREDPW